jgi:hypothetical protein
VAPAASAFLSSWKASEPTAGAAAICFSRLDGDEPDGDQSFNGSYREAMKELDNDNEHGKMLRIGLGANSPVLVPSTMY